MHLHPAYPLHNCWVGFDNGPEGTHSGRSRRPAPGNRSETELGTWFLQRRRPPSTADLVINTWFKRRLTRSLACFLPDDQLRCRQYRQKLQDVSGATPISSGNEYTLVMDIMGGIRKRNNATGCILTVARSFSTVRFLACSSKGLTGLLVSCVVHVQSTSQSAI